jgi:hypothetical protein
MPSLSDDLLAAARAVVEAERATRWRRCAPVLDVAASASRGIDGWRTIREPAARRSLDRSTLGNTYGHLGEYALAE